MTVIRPATPDDARAIAHVQVETWKVAYRGIIADEILNAMSKDERAIRWSELLQRPKYVTFVAIANHDGIAGFANGGPERDGREEFQGELCGLYVHPVWQRQGLGKRLVAAFAQWLLEVGFNSMIVWTLADNPSRRFYEHLGGKLVGKKDIVLGQQKLIEIAYGWDDLGVLLEGGQQLEPRPNK